MNVNQLNNQVVMPSDADYTVQEARKRQLLVRARSILRMVYREKPRVSDPMRSDVIERLTDDITDFLDDGRPL